MNTKDFQLNKIYVIDIEKRDISKNHWHWEIYFTVEKRNTHFSIFTINLNNGFCQTTKTEDWTNSVKNCNFEEISKHKCFKLIFNEKEWKNL